VDRFRGVLAVPILGLLLAAGSPARAQGKDGQPLLHPATASQVITVAVKELRAGKHGKQDEFVIAQAAGFPNDTCDVVTTFDVVKKFEERQTWQNIKQRIDVIVNGTSYPAKFRDIGFYPLGLNLACIDFESPMDRAAAQFSVLPLDRDTQDSTGLSYDDGEIAKTDPGTPFLNQRGEISAVLIASPNGPIEFASAEEIRLFLKAAAAITAWPTVHRRNLSAI
jgi:hypothetical protein